MTLDVTGLSLRDFTSCGGCAAKADASLLKLLRSAAYDQQGIDTLVGLAAPDDAAVIAVNETTSLITTVDFFPPVVSDAFEYGYVSALNSLSDIYAMGGLAKPELLVCGFPKEIADAEIQHVCLAQLQPARKPELKFLVVTQFGSPNQSLD